MQHQHSWDTNLQHQYLDIQHSPASSNDPLNSTHQDVPSNSCDIPVHTAAAAFVLWMPDLAWLKNKQYQECVVLYLRSGCERCLDFQHRLEKSYVQARCDMFRHNSCEHACQRHTRIRNVPAAYEVLI